MRSKVGHKAKEYLLQFGVKKLQIRYNRFSEPKSSRGGGRLSLVPCPFWSCRVSLVPCSSSGVYPTLPATQELWLMQAGGTSYYNALLFYLRVTRHQSCQLEVLMGDNNLAGKCHIRWMCACFVGHLSFTL